eukprot:3387835-Pleurochrysis_carterae.AAC.1
MRTRCSTQTGAGRRACTVVLGMGTIGRTGARASGPTDQACGRTRANGRAGTRELCARAVRMATTRAKALDCKRRTHVLAHERTHARARARTRSLSF